MDDVFKSFPVLAWLLWCTGVTGVLLMGISIRLLIESIREHRHAEMLFAANSAAYPNRLATAVDGPPEGPPLVDVYC